MRVRQKHVITVVMDTAYDIVFGRLDAQHGYSISRSTQISEIDSPGTANERALRPGEEHGFLWRLNTYWSYEERDGGLYMQIESVSLTRSIPTAWAGRSGRLWRACRASRWSSRCAPHATRCTDSGRQAECEVGGKETTMNATSATMNDEMNFQRRGG